MSEINIEDYLCYKTPFPERISPIDYFMWAFVKDGLIRLPYLQMYVRTEVQGLEDDKANEGQTQESQKP